MGQRKAKSPRQEPPLDRIRAAGEIHLAYEVQMLRQTRDHLATRGEPRTNEERREVNAYVNCFTVHVRALTDFLFPKPSAHDSDVLARDYCSTWPTICAAIPKELADARERVGREIVHLSYGRLDTTPEQKRCFLDHVSAPLEAALVKLARNADPGRLTPHAEAVLLGKIY